MLSKTSKFSISSFSLSARSEKELEKYKEEVLTIKENFKEIEYNIKNFFRVCKKANIITVDSSFIKKEQKKHLRK
jgi:hypothetical protein